MRIAAVYMAQVRIELARRARRREMAPCYLHGGRGLTPTRGAKRDLPLAVVVARPGGAIKDERSLLGGTRLDEVSAEALSCGVRAGETIAAARAKCGDLLVRVVTEEAVREVLRGVAEIGLCFGPTVSIDEARDLVCIDVTGCGHLFGEGGEENLAHALCLRVRGSHAGSVRIAIADGPRVAAAIARALRKRDILVVPPGGNAEAIRTLPIAALPIEPASITWLGRLGFSKIGDLQRLPASGLATRLGAAHAEVMALLAGDDGAPLDPFIPPEVPEERAELEYGIERTEALLFVLKRLCDRLAARLAGRVMAAMKLEIVLSLDRAIARGANLPADEIEGEASLPLTFPAPLASASELLAIVKVRIEAWTIPGPILAVTLRAPELARKDGHALDLFLPEAKADRALPRLVAELAADLGERRVGTLVLVNTWVPEERSALVPYAVEAREALASFTPLGSPIPEPARILGVPLPAEGVEPLRLLARIEAVAWWRLGVNGRDFVAGWSPADERMAWLEVDRATGRTLVKGWLD